MQRIISYSLWGNSALYCSGMLTNLKLAKKFYPDFRVRVYTASDCPALSILKQEDCDVIEMPPTKGIDRENKDWKWDLAHSSMMWRYFVIDELQEGDCAIFRDADSHLSQREADCVYRWLETPHLAHAIYENATHYNGGWMSGMFGVKGGVLTGISTSIDRWVEHYKTLNHDYIFIDLVYNQSVLLPIINPSFMRFGFGTPNPLPPLENIEDSVGWVKNDHLRNKEFNPEEYLIKKFVDNYPLQEKIYNALLGYDNLLVKRKNAKI